MSLTNDELLNRIRAQTDMIQQAQQQADQAYQTAFNLGTRVEDIASAALLSSTKADATSKATDTTQKLLKELIQEIKDLREEGEVQQRQIDALHKDMDEFKDMVNTKINQCYQEIQNNKSAGDINISPYFGSPYRFTCDYNDGSVITTFDENGNQTGHTAFINVDMTEKGDKEKKTEKVEITDKALNDLMNGGGEK